MKSSFLFGRGLVGLSILLPLFSSGCSISMYKSRSECMPPAPISCQPVSKINDLINENRLEDFIRQQNCKSKPCKLQKAVSKEEQVISKKGEVGRSLF